MKAPFHFIGQGPERFSHPADASRPQPTPVVLQRGPGITRLLQPAVRGLCLSLVALLAVPAAGQTIWTGAGGDDFWFNNNNWDTASAPNGTTVDVIVGAPNPTLVNGSVNINSLVVGADGILTLQANQDFDFGGTATTTLTNEGIINTENNTDFQLSQTVNNIGTINVNAGPSFTDLEVRAGGATLIGGGTISLQGVNARIDGVSNPLLTISDQTIQGFGNIGTNSVQLANLAAGLINANSLGNTLIVDPNAAGMTNSGIMQASGGGILRLNAAAYDNTGGTIQALAGSEVLMTGGVNISNGLITTSGDGVIRNDFNNSVFYSDLTLAGTMISENNTDTGFSGTINNTGSISINAGASFTDIEIQAGGANLTGGGTINLSGVNARFDGISNPLLTISDQTIQGFGNIGTNSMEIVNQAGGIINANSNGNTLIVDPNAAGMINQGTMQASGGGILRLQSGDIDNIGGLIQALAGSEVQLDNSASVSGGTISTSGDGLIRNRANQDVFYSDLHLAGSMISENNSDTGFAGTINNTGSISVNAGASQTDIEIQAVGATLTGGGVITLNGTNARFDGVSNPLLTVANQTIQGFGNIGSNSLELNLQAGSLIDANSNGNVLIFDPSASGAVNAGTMQASGGGILRLQSATIDNTGGLIQALAGSEVRLENSATISGGTVSTSGDGIIRNSASQNVFYSDLTLAGTMVSENNTDTGFAGTINNTGSISINAGASLTDIEIQSTGATLTGGGTINLNGTNARIDGVSNPLLTIADQTIQGLGNIGTNSMEIVNQAGGVINANSNGNTLFVDPSGSSSVDWTNEGTLQASDGGILNLVHSTINEGVMDAGLGSRIVVNELNNQGTLRGNGLIDVSGDLVSGGLIGPGASPGTLTIEASDAMLEAASQLFFEIEGTAAGEFDVLDFDFGTAFGKLALDGDLLIDLNGFMPTLSDEFILLTADNTDSGDGADITGLFANVLDGGTLATVGGEGTFQVFYGSGADSNQVRISGFVANAIPEPGSAAVLLAASLLIGLRRRRS